MYCWVFIGWTRRSKNSTTIDLSKDCFSKEVSIFPFKVEPVEIPYEGTTLPRYFCYATKENINNKNKQYDKNNNKQENNEKNSNYNEVTAYPKLLVHGGFDSALKDLILLPLLKH